MYLKVKVIPKSPKTELSEIMTDASGEKIYKIRLKAAPEKGRANAELIKFLSQHFLIPKENIKIISGQTERIKLIRLDELNKQNE